MFVDYKALDRIVELETEINRFNQLRKIIEKDSEANITTISISFSGGGTLKMPYDLAAEVINKVVIPAYEETAERILEHED